MKQRCYHWTELSNAFDVTTLDQLSVMNFVVVCRYACKDKHICQLIYFLWFITWQLWLIAPFVRPNWYILPTNFSTYMKSNSVGVHNLLQYTFSITEMYAILYDSLRTFLTSMRSTIIEYQVSRARKEKVINAQVYCNEIWLLFHFGCNMTSTWPTHVSSFEQSATLDVIIFYLKL